MATGVSAGAVCAFPEMAATVAKHNKINNLIKFVRKQSTREHPFAASDGISRVIALPRPVPQLRRAPCSDSATKVRTRVEQPRDDVVAEFERVEQIRRRVWRPGKGFCARVQRHFDLGNHEGFPEGSTDEETAAQLRQHRGSDQGDRLLGSTSWWISAAIRRAQKAWVLQRRICGFRFRLMKAWKMLKARKATNRKHSIAWGSCLKT